MNTLIPWIDPGLFTQYIWSGSTIYECFNFFCRRDELIKNKNILQLHAIGYCKSEELLYRIKINEYAIMFEKDFIRFWTHIRNNEFKEIFTIGV
jgi:hypothetical protein